MLIGEKSKSRGKCNYYRKITNVFTLNETMLEIRVNNGERKNSNDEGNGLKQCQGAECWKILKYNVKIRKKLFSKRNL